MSEGYPIVGWSTDGYLMLDSDLALPSYLVEWDKKYSRFHKLGSVLIMKSSEPYQLDLDGNRLANFTSIFGKHLSWQEILCHLQNALKAGLINKKFVWMRKYGTIEERINLKNRKKSYPVFYKYIPNGDSTGCWEYANYWADNRKLGSEGGA
jgi:hypothetical protein